MQEGSNEGQRLINDGFVFFLGAGASRSEGYPLMTTFLDELKLDTRTEDTELRKQIRLAYDALLEFRAKLRVVRDAVNTDFDNIESLYSAAEMFSIAFPNERVSTRGTEVFGKDLPQLIAMAIWDMCRGRPKPKPALQAHSRLFEGLLGFDRNRTHGKTLLERSTFITTNYDLVPELAAFKNSIELSYGNVVKFDTFLEKGGAYVSPRSPVHVLKLHGSVNWFLATDGKTCCDGRLVSLQVFVGDDLVPFAAPGIQTGNYALPAGSSPLIVPPAFGKSANNDVLRSVWQDAMQAISHAKMVVFIGYSFPPTDTFVTHLLHVGLLENPDLRKVLVFNPDESVGRYVKEQLFNTVFSRNRLEYRDWPFESTEMEKDTVQYVLEEIRRLEEDPKAR